MRVLMSEVIFIGSWSAAVIVRRWQSLYTHAHWAYPCTSKSVNAFELQVDQRKHESIDDFINVCVTAMRQ